jgi:diguanylate cyclase (GGDEF)-like protein
VLRPVYALTDAAERFGRGEMSARTGMPHEDAEFGRLARGFDEMAARVERQVADQRRDEERIRRLNRMYVLLSRVSHTIVHQRERGALLEQLCRIAVEDGGFRFAWIGWLDQGLRVARPAACHGHDPSFLDNLVISVAGAGESHPAVAALREERVDVCNDIETDTRVGPWREAARTRGYRAWGAFPLRLDGHVAAVLNLHSREAGFFDADELRLLTEVALDISYALDAIGQETQRREAEKRLKFLAYHDPVTELPNLLQYDELLRGLLAQVHAEGRSFALMLVGIERLDEVTATFGHQIEGELLRLMAQRLRQNLRVDDILARGAGEHFNIVLPHADAELATRTARQLVKAMEQPFSIGSMDLELGIDIGIALFPGHSEELETLDRCAHTAMREARKAGGGYAFYSPGQDIFSPERSWRWCSSPRWTW